MAGGISLQRCFPNQYYIYIYIANSPICHVTRFYFHIYLFSCINLPGSFFSCTRFPPCESQLQWVFSQLFPLSVGFGFSYSAYVDQTLHGVVTKMGIVYRVQISLFFDFQRQLFQFLAGETCICFLVAINVISLDGSQVYNKN